MKKTVVGDEVYPDALRHAIRKNRESQVGPRSVAGQRKLTRFFYEKKPLLGKKFIPMKFLRKA